MSNYARYRDWHLWIGLVLLVPLTVIATTGILWNHEKSLGLKREHRAQEYQPRGEYQEGRQLGLPAKRESLPQPESRLVAAPGGWHDHAAAIDAALAAARDEWGPEVPLERIELRDEPRYGFVVKVKAREDAGRRPYEIVWSATTGAILEKKGDPQAGVDWAKVVHDLHTGKFFSKEYGFLWSDATGFAILALSVTGVVLYLIPVLKKREKRRNKSLSSASGAKTPQPHPSDPSRRPVTMRASAAGEV
jgi:uncharacterized iron-regulated membrane protein